MAAASGLRSTEDPDEEFWLKHHPAINPSSPANHDDLACKPGNVFDGGECKACPANTYRGVGASAAPPRPPNSAAQCQLPPRARAGMHECKPCPSGTTSDSGAQACTKPGDAAAPAAAQDATPGSGSPAGQPAAQAAAGAGSPAPTADPNHEDLACQPGNVFDGTRCKPCPANTYRAQGAWAAAPQRASTARGLTPTASSPRFLWSGMHDCLACPNGKVSSTGAVDCSDPTAAPSNVPDEDFWRQMHPSNNPSSPANHDDLACKPGSIFSGDVCKACPANTYRALGACAGSWQRPLQALSLTHTPTHAHSSAAQACTTAWRARPARSACRAP